MLPLSPIILTARNIWNYIPSLFSSKTIWLVEFYSPACRHCVEFAPVYEEIAQHYHGLANSASSSNSNEEENHHNIRVAKVNGAREPSLVTRFGIQAYPTLYLIDGWSVYEFTGNRNVPALLRKFAEGGYKASTATNGSAGSPSSMRIPWMDSGLGPVGLVQGGLVYAGLVGKESVEYVHTEWKVSYSTMGWIVFMSVFGGVLVLILCVAWCWPVGGSGAGRIKRD